MGTDLRMGEGRCYLTIRVPETDLLPNRDLVDMNKDTQIRDIRIAIEALEHRRMGSFFRVEAEEIDKEIHKLKAMERKLTR